MMRFLRIAREPPLAHSQMKSDAVEEASFVGQKMLSHHLPPMIVARAFVKSGFMHRASTSIVPGDAASPADGHVDDVPFPGGDVLVRTVVAEVTSHRCYFFRHART